MKKVFRIKNLCCANCAAKIERSIQKIAGVQEASLSFMAEKLMIECDEADLVRISSEIRRAAAKIEPGCELIG